MGIKAIREYGLPIVDAKKRKEVTVIMSDIKKAKAMDPKHCAFANACVRQDKSIKEAIIFKTTAYLVYATRIVRYRVVGSMQQEIVSFDRSGIFAGGTYWLGPISPASRLGAPRRKGSKRGPHLKKGNPPKRHRTVMVRKVN